MPDQRDDLIGALDGEIEGHLGDQGRSAGNCSVQQKRLLVSIQFNSNFNPAILDLTQIFSSMLCIITSNSITPFFAPFLWYVANSYRPIHGGYHV